MSKTIAFKFRVKDKGGPLGGKWLESEIPEFDWNEFKVCPNAREFAQKPILGG